MWHTRVGQPVFLPCMPGAWLFPECTSRGVGALQAQDFGRGCTGGVRWQSMHAGGTGAGAESKWQAAPFQASTMQQDVLTPSARIVMSHTRVVWGGVGAGAEVANLLGQAAAATWGCPGDLQQTLVVAGVFCMAWGPLSSGGLSPTWSCGWWRVITPRSCHFCDEYSTVDRQRSMDTRQPLGAAGATLLSGVPHNLQLCFSLGLSGTLCMYYHINTYTQRVWPTPVSYHMRCPPPKTSSPLCCAVCCAA